MPNRIPGGEPPLLARQIVLETLASLGVDVSDLQETQRDFAFLRDLREGTADMKRKTRLTLCGLAVSAVIYLLCGALQDHLGTLVHIIPK